MRVTRIPGDHNDIGDRPCRVWCNEVEIAVWTVADDFRRVVETPGKVHHGAVRIDLAPEMKYFDVDLPAEPPKDIEWSGKMEVFEVPQPTAKPNVHIPARKRKAGK